MNIKTLVSSGYDLWESGTGEDVYVSVPVCDPDAVSLERGATRIRGEELIISPSTNYIIPNMRTFPEPQNL